MSVAILSDIHANIEALSAVLAKIAPSDEIWCLGDIVGYGPNPNEAVAAIAARARLCILGNHEVAALDGVGLEYFNDFAAEAIEWTQGVLRAEHRSYLNGLGYEIRAGDFLLVHGAPVTYFEYILDVDDAERAFAATDARMIFVGHSHVAEAYALEADGAISHRHYQHGGTLALDPKLRYLINVGSVGQPRDLNPEASFAVFDRAAQTIVWRRVPYDIAAVRAKIAAAKLPEPLGTRLLSGR
jgi:diadenosine tetraphosphatase ApaH/serine/threonine PP2A family protein phosphatase